MNLRSIVLFAVSLALPVLACAMSSSSSPAPAPSKDAGTFQRIEIKAAKGSPLPYTIEVPQGWQGRQEEKFPGLWIGPADAKAPDDPRLIWVRGSTVSMAKPDEIAANIKANDASHAEWTAPRVEVKDLGGVKGVLVQMDTGEGDKARSSLTLKVPLPGTNTSVDFRATAARGDFPKQLPLFEKILLSVRPVAPAADAAKK